MRIQLAQASCFVCAEALCRLLQAVSRTGPSRRLRIPDYRFPGRIPAERTFQALGNAADMTDGGGAVTDLGRADRSLPSDHTLDPIALVMIG